MAPLDEVVAAVNVQRFVNRWRCLYVLLPDPAKWRLLIRCTAPTCIV